ncbi:MAG: hypothetical protein RO257_04180 [Candidatus Kapabacteria bacterium]|nr:hypothetical protein [Candidatus Kapabacteria bacterium]
MNIPMQISLVSEKTEQAIKFFFSKSYSIIPISLLIILIISGCAKEPTSPTIDETVLVPLKVGNTWEYRHTEYYYEGIIENSQQYSYSIVKDSIINGETIYISGYISGIDTLRDYSHELFTLIRDDGLYFIDLINEGTTPRMYIKYPTFKGDSFIYYHDTMKTAEVDVEYTVPAGKFKCIKYVYDNYIDNEIEMRWIFYYSPGIGNIATEFYYRYNHDHLWLNEKTVLMSFKFK